MSNLATPTLHTDELGVIGATLAVRYEALLREGVPAHMALRVRQLQMQEPKRSPLPAARVLVVEDDPHVRLLAELVFDEVAVVVSCESAESALAILRACGDAIALVVADIRLAGPMSGTSLAAMVSERWPGTRVILTSAFPDDPPAALPTGIRFLPKPWSCADLLAEAERAIRLPSITGGRV